MGDGDHDHCDDGGKEDEDHDGYDYGGKEHDDHDDGSGEASRYFHTMASRIEYEKVRNVLIVMMIDIFVRAIMVRWMER